MTRTYQKVENILTKGAFQNFFEDGELKAPAKLQVIGFDDKRICLSDGTSWKTFFYEKSACPRLEYCYVIRVDSFGLTMKQHDSKLVCVLESKKFRIDQLGVRRFGNPKPFEMTKHIISPAAEPIKDAVQELSTKEEKIEPIKDVVQELSSKEEKPIQGDGIVLPESVSSVENLVDSAAKNNLKEVVEEKCTQKVRNQEPGKGSLEEKERKRQQFEKEEKIKKNERFGILMSKTKPAITGKYKGLRSILKVIDILNAGSSNPEFVAMDISVWNNLLRKNIDKLEEGTLIGFSFLKNLESIYHSKTQMSTTDDSELFFGDVFDGMEKAERLKAAWKSGSIMQNLTDLKSRLEDQPQLLNSDKLYW